MKKFLRLLSILTMTGTSMSTVMGATTPYETQTKDKLNEVNFQQASNLENLIWNKRENECPFPYCNIYSQLSEINFASNYKLKDLNKLEKENKELKKEIQDKEAQNKILENKNKNLDDKIQELERQKKELEDKIQDDIPFICPQFIGYNKYRVMRSTWSVGTLTDIYYDYSYSALVLNYSNYVQTFDEFIEKYPTVTIETEGEAISTSTFGNVGKDKFGTLHFDTSTFNSDDIKYVYLVNAYDNKSHAYTISVKIGLGFQKIGSRLYLTPFIDGLLTSTGAYTRELYFGINVKSITFNSKNKNLKQQH